MKLLFVMSWPSSILSPNILLSTLFLSDHLRLKTFLDSFLLSLPNAVPNSETEGLLVGCHNQAVCLQPVNDYSWKYYLGQLFVQLQNT